MEAKLLSEACELDLVTELAKRLAKKKLFHDDSEFTFILINDNEFQIIEKGNMPTNYLINEI